jgi:hypothetical protein
MHLDDALRYGESQTGAALLARDGIIGLLKLLKQLGLIGRRDTRAGVPNRYMKCAIIGFGLDGDFTGIGELNGIADEIDQDLRQAAAVAAAWWQFGGHLHLERELLVGSQGLQRAADGLSNILDGIIGQFEDELAGLDLREIENVIDQSKEMPAVGLKTFEYAQHFLGRLTISAVCHQFGVTQDGIEWCAQFVARIGQELRFMLNRILKLPALVLDLIEQPHVLYRNRSLVTEGGDQFDLLVGVLAIKQTFAPPDHHTVSGIVLASPRLFERMNGTVCEFLIDFDAKNLLRAEFLGGSQCSSRSASRVEYPRVLINDHAEEVFQDRLWFLVYVVRLAIYWSSI